MSKAKSNRLASKAVVLDCQVNTLRTFVRFHYPPPTTKARRFSGPFLLPKSPHHAGFWPAVLRVAACRNAANLPLTRPEPSLFSAWPAGRRRLRRRTSNQLRREVRCQPGPPVTHQTRPERRLGRSQGMPHQRELPANLSTGWQHHHLRPHRHPLRSV